MKPGSAESRRWHIAFCAAAGYLITSRMSDSDSALMDDMRSHNVTPLTAARVIRERVTARWAVIR
jgi:hypothetical protein